MKSLVPFAAALLAVISLIACSGQDPRSEAKQLDEGTSAKSTLAFTDTVSFISSKNDTLATIGVAVADDTKERNLGLMGIEELPANKGMLFIFDKQQPLSFWMANTPLPLDIIFVNSEKEIVRIHHSTQPYTEENFPSGEPALYAVETNGGFSVSHDIKEGMKVAF